MITGARLSDILSFNRSMVQNEIVKMTTRLLVIDRDLNMMRIEEAIAWRGYASDAAAPASPDGSIATVRSIIEQRHARANDAIQAVNESEIEISAMQKPRAATAEKLAEARVAFAEAAARIGNAVAADPQVMAARQEIDAAVLHLQHLDEWAAEAERKRGPLMATFMADPSFSYLRRRGYGMDGYRANPVARLLDRWLAARSGFTAAASAYSQIEDFASTCDGWKRECATRVAYLESLAAAVIEGAMAALDGPRTALAEALNEADGIERRADMVETIRDNAIADMLQITLGRDQDYQTMVDTFIRILARERSAAMVRVSSGPDGGDDAASTAIDEIVGGRIRLSMEADGLRMHMHGAAGRLKAVEDVVARLSIRGWNTRAVTFELDERTMLCHDLSTGRLGAQSAWNEIEESCSAGVPVRSLAA